MIDPGRDDGSQALEAALVLPVLALVLVAVMQAIAVVADGVVAQEAARRGARVAMTTMEDGTVRQAVMDVVGDREVQVDVTGSRGPGQDVTVEVVVVSRLGPHRPRVVGRSTARGEPVLGP